MDIELILRKLAKDTRYQNLFVTVKDLNGISLFKNNDELSRIQELFLSYLYFYYDIYQDIATKKVDKIVLTDGIYEEAYLYWKREKGFEREASNIKKEKKSNKNIMLVIDNKVKPREKQYNG